MVQTVKISNFSTIKMASAAILKNHKNRDISATARPIITKFGKVMQNGFFTAPTGKNLNFKNSEDGGRPPF